MKKLVPRNSSSVEMKWAKNTFWLLIDTSTVEKSTASVLLCAETWMLLFHNVRNKCARIYSSEIRENANSQNDVIMTRSNMYLTVLHIPFGVLQRVSQSWAFLSRACHLVRRIWEIRRPHSSLYLYLSRSLFNLSLNRHHFSLANIYRSRCSNRF